MSRYERTDRLQLVAFSSLMAPIAAAQIPLAVFVPAIYAQYFGLPLATLGAIFLVERIWGAAVDPLIGVLSDRTHGQFGRRKPWILAGAFLFGAATLLLFFPIVQPTPLYLTASLVAFYLAWSMMQIPYLAWSGEMSGDYHERTRIAMFQTVVSAISIFVMVSVPTIADQRFPNAPALKLALMGGVLMIALPIAVTLTLRAFAEPTPPMETQVKTPLSGVLGLVVREGALMRVLLADFAVTVGQFIRSTLIVFYVSAYVGLPKWSGGLFLIQFIFGIAAAPLWAAIARRSSKHQAAVAAEMLQAAINFALLFVLPKELPLLLALTVVQGLLQGAGNLMLRSMVADIADRHRLETGADRTAQFFSIFSVSAKAGMALAIGIALPLVAWLGFDPARTNTHVALAGLAYVFALGPAIAHVIAAALIRGFPIDEARHAEIRRALIQRDTHERREEPVTGR